MKMIASFVGGWGHAEPLLAAAEVARSWGNDVIFAGQTSVLPRLAEAGFRTIAVGPDTIRFRTCGPLPIRHGSIRETSRCTNCNEKGNAGGDVHDPCPRAVVGHVCGQQHAGGDAADIATRRKYSGGDAGLMRRNGFEPGRNDARRGEPETQPEHGEGRNQRRRRNGDAKGKQEGGPKCADRQSPHDGDLVARSITESTTPWTHHDQSDGQGGKSKARFA